MKVNKFLLAAVTVAIIVVIVLSSKLGNGPVLPKTESDYARTSVMITSADQKSGGSGVIYKSSASRSYILTNKHVCNIVQTGGIVRTDKQRYKVVEYSVYAKHDLCMVAVNADLKINTYVAQEAPEIYDATTIAGHPGLLPTIVGRGHFAHKTNLQLVVDTKPCDGSEEGPEVLMCMFTGVKPIFKEFAAQPVSALVMGGSSGSGVFNSKGELVGLVFAGPGEGIGYGFAVPYEFLKDFTSKFTKLVYEKPNPNKKVKNFLSSIREFQSRCDRRKIRNCKFLKYPGIYHE